MNSTILCGGENYNTVEKSKRNIGIDFLRMLAMFMICIIHVVDKGGVIENTVPLSAHYYAATFLNIFVLCAANCFAIISGYVGINAKYKYSNFAVLWLRVAFYTVLITAMFAVVCGGVTTHSWIEAFFPIMFKQYWYVTAYFGLFLFMPCLNLMRGHLSKKQYSFMLVAIVIFFSLMQTLFHCETFHIHYGFSVWWLMILYMIGGYIRRFGLFPSLKKRWFILLYVASVLVTWGYKIAIEYITLHYLGTPNGGGLLMDYTSPTILLSALFLFLFFERMEFKSQALIKIVSDCSSLAFSVYLIHTHPLVWERVLPGLFASFSQFSIPLMLLAVIGAAVGIYIGCSFIDAVRSLLFKILKVKEQLRKVEDKIVGDTWNDNSE